MKVINGEAELEDLQQNESFINLDKYKEVSNRISLGYRHGDQIEYLRSFIEEKEDKLDSCEDESNHFVVSTVEWKGNTTKLVDISGQKCIDGKDSGQIDLPIQQYKTGEKTLKNTYGLILNTDYESFRTRVKSVAASEIPTGDCKNIAKLTVKKGGANNGEDDSSDITLKVPYAKVKEGSNAGADGIITADELKSFKDKVDDITISGQISSGKKIGSFSIQKAGGTAASTDLYVPVAASNGLGVVKLGYTQSGTNYPVQLDGNNAAYVSVPWENTWRPIGTGADDAAAGNHNHDGVYAPASHSHPELNIPSISIKVTPDANEEDGFITYATITLNGTDYPIKIRTSHSE